MNNKQIAQRVLPLVSLTSLNDDDTEEVIKKLCKAASNVAAICVRPNFVGQVVGLLEGSGVEVAGLANFPEGHPDPEKPKKESMQIIASGGTEVDVLFPWRNLLDGDVESGSDVVSGCKSRCGNKVRLKVILETREIRDEAIIYKAARVAIDSGADFIKMSTGLAEHPDNLSAAKTILSAITDSGMPCGFEVLGAVKTLDAARAYLKLADDMMGQTWVSPKTFRLSGSDLLYTLNQEINN